MTEGIKKFLNEILEKERPVIEIAFIGFIGASLKGIAQGLDNAGRLCSVTYGRRAAIIDAPYETKPVVESVSPSGLN